MPREKKVLPLLITRGAVVFPTTFSNIDVGRLFSVSAMQKSLNETDSKIIVVAQKDISINEPTENDISLIGSLCTIDNVKEINGVFRLRVTSISRIKISKVNSIIYQDKPSFECEYTLFPIKKDEDENTIISLYTEVLDYINDKNNMVPLPRPILYKLQAKISPEDFTNVLGNYLEMNYLEKQKFLEENSLINRLNFLKERLIRIGKSKREVRNVLKDINIDIKKGETVALVGVNGSGKSTLLKLITKIIYPTKGSIESYGKVSSLLELGAGFHPDFSGRENIYFNASIFGLTKSEIDERLDKIIEFSELGEFIDTPIRTYSSGMYMRLAFSVAINVDADIILIDEILAVGDQHFQEKCMNKMLELKKEGKTMVFVSHSREAVEFLCDRAIWLKDGRIELDGKTKDVMDEYEKVCG